MGQREVEVIPSDCPICGCRRRVCRTGTVLSVFEATYASCDSCLLFQAVNPAWLNAAYDNAISDADTGLLVRNTWISKRVAAILYSLHGGVGEYIDIAGGYGVLTRMMRDLGFDFYWWDPFARNIFARGFEADPTKTYVGATAIEVLEHVQDPLAFLSEVFVVRGARTIVTTTELFTGKVPAADWPYLLPGTGQHITFMHRRTLRVLAQKLNCRVYSRNDIHIFTKERSRRFVLFFCASRGSSVVLRRARKRLGPRTKGDSDYALRVSQAVAGGTEARD